MIEALVITAVITAYVGTSPPLRLWWWSWRAERNWSLAGQCIAWSGSRRRRAAVRKWQARAIRCEERVYAARRDLDIARARRRR